MIDKLPNSSNTSVDNFHNETPDSATINRPFNRLLENDIYVEGHVQDILSTVISDGLVGEIADFLKLDETYINNILNDIADQNGTTATISDLIDVLVLDPENQQILSYDSGVGYFINLFVENVGELEGYIEYFVYLDNITHDTISTEPQFESQNDARIYTYEYDVTQFKSNNEYVNVNTIKGFFLDINLFGQLNTNDLDGQGGAEWSVSCVYPDGSEQIVLKYHTENVDDDGGIGRDVFIPFDIKASPIFKIIVKLENNRTDWVDSEGRTLNYLKISKIKTINIDSGIDSDKNQHLVNGSVSPEDATIISNGYVETGATDGYYVWDSQNNQVFTDWDEVTPIVAPERTVRSIIEFENYTVSDGVSTSDIGATTGAVGTAIGRVVIDWVTEEVTGNINLYKGSSMELIGSAVLQGGINTSLSFNLLNNNLAGVDIHAGIKTSFRRISGLPVVIDNILGVALGKLQYVITHYNSKGTNVTSNESLTCIHTSNDVAPHNITDSIPSQGLASIQESSNKYSISRYFSFSEENNGTDGGLKYRFNIPYQYINNTNVGIAKEIFNSASLVPFPNGTRAFFVKQEECINLSPEAPPEPEIPAGSVGISNDGEWSPIVSMSKYPMDEGRTNNVSGQVQITPNGVAEFDWVSGRFGSSGPSNTYTWRIRITDPTFLGALEVRARLYNGGAAINDRYSNWKEVDYFVVDSL